jgi:hypothetical protein
LTSVNSLFEEVKISKESLRTGEEAIEDALLPDLAVWALEKKDRAGEVVSEDEAD